MVPKTKTPSKAEGDLEIVPDAWERFERAVDVVIKSGPKHKGGARQKEEKETYNPTRVNRPKNSQR